MTEAERRREAIEKHIREFLADPDTQTLWDQSRRIGYTIIRTGPHTCKIVWDDGITAYADWKEYGVIRK